MILLNDRRRAVQIIEGRDQDLVFQALWNACRAAYGAWEFRRCLPFSAHHGIVMAAMKGAFKLEDFVTTTKGASDAQGKKRRLSARGRKADLFGTRHGVDNGLSQLDGLFVQIK